MVYEFLVVLSTNTNSPAAFCLYILYLVASGIAVQERILASAPFLRVSPAMLLMIHLPAEASQRSTGIFEEVDPAIIDQSARTPLIVKL